MRGGAHGEMKPEHEGFPAGSGYISLFDSSHNTDIPKIHHSVLGEYFPVTRVRLPSKPAHEPSNGPKLPVSDVCAIVL